MTSSSPPPPQNDSETFNHDADNEGGDPLSMGDDGKLFRLSGSLFFALPDGGAVLYRLEGFAEGPEAVSTTELETPAKTTLAFTLPVSNWLRHAQR